MLGEGPNLFVLLGFLLMKSMVYTIMKKKDAQEKKVGDKTETRNEGRSNYK